MTSQLIFLNSNDATKLAPGPSDIIFNLNFANSNDMENYAISIQQVVLPNAVYPINSNNNKLYWNEDGGATITSTITPGSYSGTQIASEIATQMNADSIGRTYGCTYSSITKKLTVTESVGLPNTFAFFSGSNDIITETGFDGNGSTHSTTYVANYPVYLAGTQYVDIQCDISSNNYSSNGKSNVLQRIPITANFGSVIIHQEPSDDFIRLNEESLNTLEIRILDDKGNLWDLPANAQVSAVLKLQRFI